MSRAEDLLTELYAGATEVVPKKPIKEASFVNLDDKLNVIKSQISEMQKTVSVKEVNEQLRIAKAAIEKARTILK